MNADEVHCFKLIDKFPRTKHNCFLAEFDARGGDEYQLCFRPASGNRDSASRYACRYLTIKTTDLKSIVLLESLPPWAAHLLDEELSRLVVAASVLPTTDDQGLTTE
jgi:hypothetical protein